jgi:flagellar basal-body rod modification protein FlgD
MTAINELAAYKFTGAGSGTTKTSSSNDSSNDFMELLLAQMRNQSPWDPMDDSQMISQMAQLNSVEQLQKINKTLEEMKMTTNFLSTASMIGKYASYVKVEGSEKVTVSAGKISAVASDGKDIFVTIGDDIITLPYLLKVAESEADLDLKKSSESTEG